MRFSLPALRQDDKTKIRRCKARVTSSVFHFSFLSHLQSLSIQLIRITTIVTAGFQYFDIDGLCPSAMHRNLAWQGVSP